MALHLYAVLSTSSFRLRYTWAWYLPQSGGMQAATCLLKLVCNNEQGSRKQQESDMSIAKNRHGFSHSEALLFRGDSYSPTSECLERCLGTRKVSWHTSVWMLLPEVSLTGPARCLLTALPTPLPLHWKLSY